MTNTRLIIDSAPSFTSDYVHILGINTILLAILKQL